MILQMVILHNAIKTIQNGVFVFFWKKNKNLFHLKKTKNTDWKTEGLNVFHKTVFFQPWLSLKTFFVIFPWSQGLEQVTSLSVWLDVRQTPRAKDPGNEEAENYWHLNT